MSELRSDLPKLGRPAQRALSAAGITKLQDLTKITERELTGMHGIGPKAVKSIREAMKERGFSFKQ